MNVGIHQRRVTEPIATSNVIDTSRSVRTAEVRLVSRHGRLATAGMHLLPQLPRLSRTPRVGAAPGRCAVTSRSHETDGLAEQLELLPEGRDRVPPSSEGRPMGWLVSCQ